MVPVVIMIVDSTRSFPPPHPTPTTTQVEHSWPRFLDAGFFYALGQFLEHLQRGLRMLKSMHKSGIHRFASVHKCIGKPLGKCLRSWPLVFTFECPCAV